MPQRTDRTAVHFVPGYGYTGSGNGESAGTYDKNMSLRIAGDSSADLS
jgi:hypothetical protein